MGEVRQREPSIEIPALRELVRGMPCMFRIPGVCNGNDEGTMWCHSNHSRHGKGMGKKSHDLFGAIGCKPCHDWYDTESRRLGIVSLRDQEARTRAFLDAHERSLVHLWLTGHIKFIR